ADGRFQLDALVPGTYQPVVSGRWSIEGQPPQHRSHQLPQSITVQPGETRQLVLALELVPVAIEAVDEAGQPQGSLVLLTQYLGPAGKVLHQARVTLDGEGRATRIGQAHVRLRVRLVVRHPESARSATIPLGD